MENNAKQCFIKPVCRLFSLGRHNGVKVKNQPTQFVCLVGPGWGNQSIMVIHVCMRGDEMMTETDEMR